MRRREDFSQISSSLSMKPALAKDTGNKPVAGCAPSAPLVFEELELVFERLWPLERR